MDLFRHSVRDYANRGRWRVFHTGLHLSNAYCALSIYVRQQNLIPSSFFSALSMRIYICVCVYVCVLTLFQLNNLNNEQQKMLSKAIKSTRATFDVHFLTHYRFCRHSFFFNNDERTNEERKKEKILNVGEKKKRNYTYEHI